MKIKRFWLVYGMAPGAPIVTYRTFDDAEHAAQGLALTHPGTTFSVMQAITAYRAPERVERVEVTWENVP